MEGLKDLEDQQRVFFELGAKISLIEEKEKSSNTRISELELEQEPLPHRLWVLRRRKTVLVITN